MKLLFFRFFLIFSFFPVAFARGTVISKLSVQGNQFIETSIIKQHLKLKEGESYSPTKAGEDVRNLYKLGFFEDVEVLKKKTAKNSVDILYRIQEKPLIGKIDFEGNEEFSEEDLKEILEMKEFEFVNFKDLEKTLTALKKKYRENGYFLSEVSFKVQSLKKSGGKVRLIVQINEGEKVFIKKINFIGNRRFASKKLKSLMMTRERGILSFLDSSGIYNPLHLERDIQLIEYMYRDKGYLNVRLQKPEISLTADKRHIYINLTVSEGYRFYIGQIDFKEDGVVKREKVLEVLELGKSSFFSLGRMLKDLKFIENLYKEKGYAFAKAFPEILPDESEDNKVHVLFKVEKGASYKVGKIKIFGNKDTRDKVILRQFSLVEGGKYKKSQQEESQALTQRLGFFEEVKLKLKKRGEKKKVLDVEVHIKEKEHTGEAHLAGGYNSLYKVFVRGGVKKVNFLGLGHSISLQGEFSRFQEIFNFNYLNPYLWDTNWSFSLDIFNMNQDRLSNYYSVFFSEGEDQNLFSYSQMNRGFTLSIGRHLTDYFSSFLKYRLQRQFLSDQSFLLTSRIFGFFDEEPEETESEKERKSPVNLGEIVPLKEGEGVISSLTGIFEYDKRNDRYHTTKGYYGQLSLEYAGLGGDFKHTKIQGNVRHYQKLFWKFILKNSLNFGMVFSNEKGKDVLFTELFLLGGPYNLRGFAPNTVGPRKYSQKAYDFAREKGLKNPEAVAHYPYGGSKMFYYNLEMEAPLIKEAGIFGAVFFDIGEAANQFTLNFDKELRADVGAGIRWRAPFGLIRIDWGIPFFPKKELGEEKMQFQFSIGSAF